MTATAFTPFDSCTIAEDPATFSPATMIGVISTDIYPLQGEIKVAGAVKMPLYASNGLQMFLGSIGQDNTTGYGIYGTPHIASAGSPGNTTSATSFAATGVTSITLASATGFASQQVLLISGSTDPAGGSETVGGTLSGTTFTVTSPSSGTTKTHSGTITVQTAGAMSAGSVSVGGSTITLQTGLGALFTNNDIVQVDLSVAGSTTSEVRKITKSSDTLTIADSSPNATWAFAHGATVQVFNVTGGVWYHQVPAGSLNSYTVEQNVAGIESLQWPGCKFSKGSLACPSGNSAANITVDVMGAAAAVILGTPTAASTTTESPFIFAEATFTALGVAHPEAYNIKLDWDNVLKATYTYSGSHYPSFLTKTDFHVNCTFDAVFHNFDDSNDGWWNKMNSQTQGSLDFKLLHTATGMTVDVNLPLIVYSKAAPSYSVGNVVVMNMAAKSFYGLSTTTPNMVATVGLTGTGNYLPL